MILEFDESTLFWEGMRIQPVRISDEYIRSGIPMHSHAADCLELHFILSGKGRVKTPESDHALSAGFFYVTLGGEAHEQSSDAAQPVRELCIYASYGRDRKTGAQAKTFLSHRFFIGQANEDLFFAVQKTAKELSEKRVGYAEAIKNYFALMLVYIARAEADERSRAAEKTCGGANDIFLKIEEAFLYEYRTVTLTALADKTGMSARQLQRLLKERYGATFSQKKTEARMRAANLLLEEGKLPITRIAEETGYSCVEHFCAEYKKHFHATASDYRRRARAKRS